MEFGKDEIGPYALLSEHEQKLTGFDSPFYMDNEELTELREVVGRELADIKQARADEENLLHWERSQLPSRQAQAEARASVLEAMTNNQLIERFIDSATK